MRRSLFFAIALVVIVADQASKYWIVGHLPFDVSLPVIPPVFFLTRTINIGGAFGLLPGATWVMEIMALAAVIAIFLVVLRAPLPMRFRYGIALAMPLGGALGNLLDRVRLHYVVDFLDMRLGTYPWPIFNLADTAICIGVLMLALTLMGRHAVAGSCKEPSAGPNE